MLLSFDSPTINIVQHNSKTPSEMHMHPSFAAKSISFKNQVVSTQSLDAIDEGMYLCCCANYYVRSVSCSFTMQQKFGTLDGGV